MGLFNSIRHLLPTGRAWAINTPGKNLYKFFQSLGDAADEAKNYADLRYLDYYSQTTTKLSDWETEFALPAVGLAEQERRDRLLAARQALGGQDPYYIQKTLRARGFDVYVHEWWDPADELEVNVQGQIPPRSPLAVLRQEYTGAVVGIDCGEPLAQCGEPTALCGNTADPRGYPLVNKVYRSVPAVQPQCGEQLAQCGEPTALCGYYNGFRDEQVPYTVPDDAAYWPYFIYIGGETFGDLAQVEPSRQDELENLCLKICPSQLWIGMLVEYV